MAVRMSKRPRGDFYLLWPPDRWGARCSRHRLPAGDKTMLLVTIWTRKLFTHKWYQLIILLSSIVQRCRIGPHIGFHTFLCRFVKNKLPLCLIGLKDYVQLDATPFFSFFSMCSFILLLSNFTPSVTSSYLTGEREQNSCSLITPQLNSKKKDTLNQLAVIEESEKHTFPFFMI